MMIDLHNHLLPALDDGPPNLQAAVLLAQQFVDDGTSVVACTPHIQPGVYLNTGWKIRETVQGFQRHLNDIDCPLKLVSGAENHVVPTFLSELARGHLLTLAGTRYVLVEPPHHVAPPRLGAFLGKIASAGYVPILVHPERLAWIAEHYFAIREWAQHGVWIQVTAGALCNRFGTKADYWAQRLVGDGLTHILASDAHDHRRRRPSLAAARQVAERLVGQTEANNLVVSRPQGILENQNPEALQAPAGLLGSVKSMTGRGQSNEQNQSGDFAAVA